MLETARLVLRPPIEADTALWGALLADAEVMRYLGGPQVRDSDWLEFALFSTWKPPRTGMLSVVEKATNRWIGRIGAWRPQGWPATEIGWTLTRDAWGRGLATEGAAAAIDWALRDLGLDDIIHVIHPANLVAAGVARKLGSAWRRAEPLNRGALLDIWGQTPDAWRLNRARIARAAGGTQSMTAAS